MRFELSSTGHKTILRAVFEESDRYQGARQEGPGTTIVYSGDDIEFDYAVGSIHPDLLGLLCLTIFYPFVGERVLFPTPVSPRLEQAFRNASFKNQFRFDNIDPSVEMYSGSRLALSFGGGIDSSAIRTLFPEAYVVHEAHLRAGCLVPSETHRVVQDMGLDHGRLVTTNQRYVSWPGGWHGWTCAFATALLMATDHDFGLILMGSTLRDTLLRGGTGYFDRFRAREWHGATGNYWQTAFNAVGIPVFSPVCGASAFMTMKLSLELIRAGDVFYCSERTGRACLRCPKCLRRDVIRALVDPAHSPEWGGYDRRPIHKYLEHDPLTDGHIFSFARNRVDGLPRFVRSRIKDLPEIRSQWPLRVHEGTFDFCDDRWSDTIRERAQEQMEPMQPEDVAEMEGWDSTRRGSALKRARARFGAGGTGS